MFSKILVCSDGSNKALYAASVAAEIARKFNSRLILLVVFDPNLIPAITLGIPDGELLTAAGAGCYAEAVQGSVEKETGRVFQQAGVDYETRRELGHPVDRITCVAEDEKADLIVVGSRGLGGIDRLLLGSVSEGVLRHAHCPVLVAR